MPRCYYCLADYLPSFSWTSLLPKRDTQKLCSDCQSKIERVVGELCRICGRPMKNLAPEFRKDDLCLDCTRWKEDERFCTILEENRSVYVYNDFMKEMIAKFKFRGDYELLFAFEQDFSQVYKQYFAKLKPLLVPIPLSEERLVERSFNQSLGLATLLKSPIQELLGVHSHEKQSKKTRQDRLALENLFYLKEEIDLKGQTILLVDDIYTTGSTLRHAGEALKRAGAEKIFALTLARG